ncbi:unnamed protein product, partial [Soboliphyme baturini]|uniref:Crinkler (CRN) family protein n=1 Tax=Soboliphyme baturini TaxID=241478 RepID=A0A183J0T5_9BILA
MTEGSKQNWNTVFSVLREQYRRRFFELLDSNEGSKVLVWDPDLIQPFNLLTGFKELQDRKVVQMLQLKTRISVASGAAHVVFVLRPVVANMQVVADAVLDAAIGSIVKFHLLFVPQRSVVCEHKLKQLDALSVVTSIHELPVFFFLWDKDVMSMEREDLLERVLVEEDDSLLFTVAMAMVQLQKGFGQIRHFYCKGEHSCKVYRMMKNVLSKEKLANFATRFSPINSVIMLDRSIDLITPL